MKSPLKKLSAALILTAVAGSASATILTQFDGITAGQANFDATVTGSGGTVTVDVWDDAVTSNGGTEILRTGYKVTANNGGTLNLQNSSGNYNNPGLLVDIDPAGGGSNPRTDPLDYFGSGLSFTFDSGVNSFGFQVDDWATCCHNPVSELFISFDGGTPILVASADDSSDGEFPDPDNPSVDTFAIFVSAFDDSSSFNTVSFWGNGIGEVLNAGSVIRYANVDQGSLPPVIGVPTPGSLLLMALGIVGFGAMRRKA